MAFNSDLLFGCMNVLFMLNLYFFFLINIREKKRKFPVAQFDTTLAKIVFGALEEGNVRNPLFYPLRC